MNRTEQNPEALLDAAIAAVREDEPDVAAVAESSRRVWARLQGQMSAAAVADVAEAPLTCCEDYRQLFAGYREGTLSPSRHLLVQDHLHECVRCRKALHPVTIRMTPAMVSEMPQRRTSPKRWLMAAAATAVISSLGFYGFEMLAPVPGGGRMQLVAASGAVYKLHRGEAASVSSGDQLELGQTLRTSGGGRAMVKLHDGSLVEVSERAEFTVQANRRDTTVHLTRGNIIVQAAKRDRGHLYVASQDSRVSVTGTVFAVSRGLRGSRVSVIEGSVDVAWRGKERSLKPGDQVTTDSSLGSVPVQQEIAWSINYDKHLALLKQFVDLGGKLKQVEVAGLRYGSRLLPYVPTDTTIYVALPNLGRAVGEVQRIVSAQATQSAELRDWLRTQFPQFEKAAKQIETLGQYLGDEIVVSFSRCNEFCGVFVADVDRPGLSEFLQKEIPAGAPVRVVDLANLPASGGDSLIIALANNRVFVGQSPQLIRQAAEGNSRFADTEFGRSITDVYRRGTGLLVAANLGDLVQKEKEGHGVFSALGIDSVKHLIAEQREMGGRPTYSAVVSFAGQRHGVASWLAQPGSMGGLGFISPDALFATAWVVKDPAQMLQDALALMRVSPHRGDTPDVDLQAKTGVDLSQLAAALGGEAVFALDGPMIPSPAWRIVLEVKDSQRVQEAIEKFVAALNRQGGAGKFEITSAPLDSKASGVANLTAYTIHVPAGPFLEAHYAYVDGYLVMATSPAFLQRAIGDRRSGVSLARSGQFRSLLPAGEHVNASGIVYQNAGELLRLVASGASDVAGKSPERQTQVAELAREVEPGLIAIYGGTDRIEVASRASALNLLSNSLVSQVLGFTQAKGTSRAERSYR